MIPLVLLFQQVDHFCTELNVSLITVLVQSRTKLQMIPGLLAEFVLSADQQILLASSIVA